MARGGGVDLSQTHSVVAVGRAGAGGNDDYRGNRENERIRLCIEMMTSQRARIFFGDDLGRHEPSRKQFTKSPTRCASMRPVRRSSGRVRGIRGIAVPTGRLRDEPYGSGRNVGHALLATRYFFITPIIPDVLLAVLLGVAVVQLR